MKFTGLSELKEKLKAKRRVIATSVVILLTALLAVPVILGAFSIQHVRRIVIKGDSPYSAEELIAASGVEYGQLLYRTDPEEVRKNVLSGAPYVRDVKITRIFSHLIIRVNSDTAKYYVTLSGKSGEYFLLSDDLRVLECRLSKEGLEEAGIVYLELPELRTCRVGDFLVFGDREKSGFVSETLDYFSKQDYADSITAIGLPSRFDDCYVTVYGRCRIELGKPADLDLKIERARRILEEYDGRAVTGYMIINVSDTGVPPTVREVDGSGF